MGTRSLWTDTITGRRLRTVAVGLGPAAPAVEERRGYVFVVNSRGTPSGPGSVNVRLTLSPRRARPRRLRVGAVP